MSPQSSGESRHEFPSPHNCRNGQTPETVHCWLYRTEHDFIYEKGEKKRREEGGSAEEAKNCFVGKFRNENLVKFAKNAIVDPPEKCALPFGHHHESKATFGGEFRDFIFLHSPDQCFYIPKLYEMPFRTVCTCTPIRSKKNTPDTA